MSHGTDSLQPDHWVDQHGDAMFGYAVLRVDSPAVAEDLVQDAMLAALDGRAGFDGRSSERTWLIGILRHKVLDHLRRRGREVPFDTGETDTEELDSQFDDTGHWQSAPADWLEPGRLLDSARLGVALNDCIDALPDRLRTLFVLRERDGLDTDELITTLGISSRNNVWVMLSRCRERLRHCLERQGIAGG